MLPTTKSTQGKAIIKALLYCTLFTVLLFGLSFLKPLFPNEWERAVYGVIGTMAALGSTLVFVYLDKSSLSVIGWRPNGKTIYNFLFGLLIGLVVMGLITSSVILFSDFQVKFNHQLSLIGFLGISLPLVVLAFFEEAAFRGYPFQILKQKMDLRSTLLLSSLFFALYHIASGWGIQQALLGPGVWGIIFGLAAYHGNGISRSTGLHYGVNLTSSAFGIDPQTRPIWILTQSNGGSLANYQSSALEILLPQLLVLCLAIFAMKFTIQKMRATESNL